ncbi:MAG: HAMP domain-containing histidine kinase [Labilibaculum sp.]|nr:HAMP domain-containing sensor histidine kinase [Labilibaculum sp.]MBI9058135.1 HAMP domain-containing histidine kinase [Labilibaculum sp.]
MSTNKINSKKLKIISPMVLSMLLLITFVGYWLYNQYYHEKKNLQSNLSSLYHSTNQDAGFILYYKNILKPALNFTDTTNYSKLNIIADKTSVKKKKEYIIALNKFIKSNEKHYTKLFNTIDSKLMVPDSLDKNWFYDIYRIGYKYQIYSTSRINPNQQVTTDTSYQFFQNLFLRKLNKKFTDIKIKKEEEIENLNSDNLNKIKSQLFKRGKLGILLYRNGSAKPKVLLFDNYFLYLISIILPQIIFALVLIGFSIFALVFAYRSYLTQMRLNLLRSDFISNITHELKIPVATAKTALEAILNFGISDDKEKTKSYLKMVALEMNRLDKLTTRVLEHSRLETRQHLLHKEVTNLNDFIDRIRNSVQMIYPDSIIINYENPSEIITLPIDQVYIEGVIRNLIDNSIKYGGKGVNIKVKLWQNENQVFISIEDNGPGIAKEYIDKVFDQFFRVPIGNQHNVKGFGLGLSFAALVMQQHNGKISVENLKEKGCRFTLKFTRS